MRLRVYMQRECARCAYAVWAFSNLIDSATDRKFAGYELQDQTKEILFMLERIGDSCGISQTDTNYIRDKIRAGDLATARSAMLDALKRAYY